MLTNIKSLKADISSVSPLPEQGANCSDEGLALEISTFKLFTVANLHFQLSCGLENMLAKSFKESKGKTLTLL